MVGGLSRVTRTRKSAEREAKAVRADFKRRGITNRRIVVRKLSFKTVRSKTRKNIPVSAKKPGFGIFFFNKKKRRSK